MNVNLRHYFFTVQSVKEIMIKNKSGVIVNVGSISWMIGQGGMAIYTAAKSGVVGLTRSFARDLQKQFCFFRLINHQVVLISLI